jgi:hypothetical protein
MMHAKTTLALIVAVSLIQTACQPPAATRSPTATIALSPTPLPATASSVKLPPLPDRDIPDVMLWHVAASEPGLWNVRPNGLMQLISADFDATLRAEMSPDGKQLLYATADWDVWLMDIASGETRNVTNTPDRSEGMPRWWPGHPDSFLCGSWDNAQGAMGFGYLTEVRFDGTYQVLDPRGELYLAFAPSPDGQSIAYLLKPIDENLPSGLWLYRRGEGPQPVPVVADAFTKPISVEDVSWSPDNRLGIALTEGPAGTPRTLTAVVDVKKQSVEVLRTYSGIETDASGASNAPHWSPSGDWLVMFTATDDVANDSGIWLNDAQGTHPLLTDLSGLYQGSHHTVGEAPSISPDGRWVAAFTSNGDIIFMRVGDWKPFLWPVTDQWKWIGWGPQD